MEQLVITNVTLLDARQAQEGKSSSVIVSGGVIRWVGPHDALPSVSGDSLTIDGTGQFLLPGFIDSHVHFSLDAKRLNPAKALHDPPGYGYYTSLGPLASTLQAGITTARDLGGTSVATARAIEDGLIAGPNLIVADKVLGPTGGHGDFRTACGFDQGTTMAADGKFDYRTDGAAEALRATREVIRLGAGVIKVMASGGVWSPRDTPWHDGLNVEEMKTVVEEAASHDVPVAAHAQSARSIRNALKAGVRSIEHGYEIDETGIEMHLASGSFLVPTLSTGRIPPNPATAAPYAVEKKRRLQESLDNCVSKAIAAGVNVAMGTDAGITTHGANLGELIHLTELGMSPRKAIEAGTLTAARLLGIDDRTGTVEAGKDADLILTRVDPLRSLAALAQPRNIHVVIQRGRVVKDDDLVVVRGAPLSQQKISV